MWTFSQHMCILDFYQWLIINLSLYQAGSSLCKPPSNIISIVCKAVYYQRKMTGLAQSPSKDVLENVRISFGCGASWNMCWHQCLQTNISWYFCIYKEGQGIHKPKHQETLQHRISLYQNRYVYPSNKIGKSVFAKYCVKQIQTVPHEVMLSANVKSFLFFSTDQTWRLPQLFQQFLCWLESACLMLYNVTDISE